MQVNSLWSFRIKDSSGNLVANLPGARSKRVTLGLNKSGEASFKYSLKELCDIASNIGLTFRQLLNVSVNYLEVLRNGSVFYSGPITNAEIILNQIDTQIEVKSLGWLSLLKYRHTGLLTDRVFTSTDSSQIAWTIIEETQALTNGNFGIIEGTLEASLTRDITYTRKEILEAIQELSEAVGFDFEITSSKIFNIFYPFKGQDKSDDVIFRYPGSNIESIQEVIDGNDIANHIMVVGRGWADAEESAVSSDVDSQLVYKRREKIDSYKDISNAVVLADIGASLIDENKGINPYFKIKVRGNGGTPDLDDYNIGDFVYFKVKTDCYSIDRALRIFEIDVQVENNDLENINLTVGMI